MTPIQDKVAELKQQGISAGDALSDEIMCRAGGLMQVFERFTIVYHASLGAFYIPADIYADYEMSGGPNKSPLGYPIADVEVDKNTAVQTSAFELGTITLHPKEGIKIELNKAVSFKRETKIFSQKSSKKTGNSSS